MPVIFLQAIPHPEGTKINEYRRAKANSRSVQQAKNRRGN